MSYCMSSKDDALHKNYHDYEWGIPLYNDRDHFEYLTLEVMQAGLSWDIVLKKREIFRENFDQFDFNKIASYDSTDIERLMNTEGMIRYEKKIEAIINNARQFQKMIEEFGSFSEYIWSYSDGKTILYDKHKEGYIPASNGLSEEISKDLKKYGFKFIGPVTIYSHLQAAGIINDHDQNCFSYHKINETYPTVKKERYLENNVKYYGE